VYTSIITWEEETCKVRYAVFVFAVLSAITISYDFEPHKLPPFA